MKKPKPMPDYDATIQPTHLTDIRRHLRRRSLKQASLDLFDQESHLAEYVGNRFEALRRLLKKNGLPASNKEAVLHAVTRVLIEPLLLLDLAHRRLWVDLLPTELMQTQWRQCVGVGRVRRKTFAECEWEPRQVQSLRPDLTEFQAKLFLERNEIEISKAMRIAGAKTIADLLKEEAKGCSP